MVSAAVVEMHAQALRERPEWFWHLMKRCEARADKIASQAALGPYSCGEASYIAEYAKTLPVLVAEALEAFDEKLAEQS
jgi:hypothetical protein